MCSVRRSRRAQRELRAYFEGVASIRRREPREDLMSALLAVEDENGGLSTDELYETCALLLVAGHETKVDVGEVNGHIFINNSSLGLYPSLLHNREKQQRLGWGKWPAYLWAAVAVLRRYPFLDVRVGVDGAEFKSHTPFVFIGNNEYEMETLNIGSRICLDKGELSLYVTNRTGRLGLIRLALRALLGGLHQEKDFFALCTKEIWIGTKHKRIRVAFDGEVTVLAPPLHYRSLPAALRVLTPAKDFASRTDE